MNMGMTGISPVVGWFILLFHRCLRGTRGCIHGWNMERTERHRGRPSRHLVGLSGYGRYMVPNGRAIRPFLGLFSIFGEHWLCVLYPLIGRCNVSTNRAIIAYLARLLYSFLYAGGIGPPSAHGIAACHQIPTGFDLNWTFSVVKSMAIVSCR